MRVKIDQGRRTRILLTWPFVSMPRRAGHSVARVSEIADFQDGRRFIGDGVTGLPSL